MGWDPTPRLQGTPFTGAGAYPDTGVMVGNTPANFRTAFASLHAHRPEMITIYAWNEWTEGGYLEPEATTGLAYLEAIRTTVTAPLSY